MRANIGEEIGEIKNKTFKFNGAFYSILNDVLIPTSDVTPNGLATASCIMEDGILLGGDILVVRIPKTILNGVFLSYYIRLNRSDIMKRVKGVTVYHLHASDMKDFVVCYPNSVTQSKIVEILNNIEKEISKLEQKLEKQKQIKQGMMQNLLTGKIRLPGKAESKEVEKKEVKIKKLKHNEQINEAVVLSFLVHKFGTDTYPLSRFRYTKYAYLLHRQYEKEARGFDKFTAGPYKPENRYKGAEGIALKNKYILKVSNPKSQKDAFIANENIVQALNYFNDWYGEDIQTWIEQFRYYKNDYLEVLTTVDNAICDLIEKNITVNIDTIKAYIASVPQWKSKLGKSYFFDLNIQKAIDESIQLFESN